MLQNMIEFGKTQMETNIEIVKLICIVLYTYYTNFKLLNIKFEFNIKSVGKIYLIIVIALLSGMIRYKTDFTFSIIFLILTLSIVWDKYNISKSMLITIISLSINYSVFLISVIFNFIVNVVIKLNTDLINLVIILSLQGIMLNFLFRINKFKYGITFIKNNNQSEYLDILILNISVFILLAFMLLTNANIEFVSNISIAIIIFVIIMFITIQKSLQLYYKQKLLIKELEETKEELANKEKEIEQLEAENLKISKNSHTIVHKQKSLEHKLKELITKTEISNEEVGELTDRLNKINQDIYKEKETVELSKTGILQIDDMLEYMQSECKKNKIDFELQINGNIHYMTNNLISKEDLETLLADHIKNAIIAINHTNNVNKSILVRLGEIDGIYSLYIYDSGAEFEKQTLEKLGKIPSTTHEDEGGTGMGFMNTFDTLKRCKASLTIEEYNEPSKDNYTKVLMIKFDNKNEFNIKSYRFNTI